MTAGALLAIVGCRCPRALALYAAAACRRCCTSARSPDRGHRARRADARRRDPRRFVRRRAPHDDRLAAGRRRGCAHARSLVLPDTFAGRRFPAAARGVALRPLRRRAGRGSERRRRRLTREPRLRVDEHAALALRLCAQQVQVERHERRRVAAARSGPRPDASARAAASDRPGDDRVDAQVRAVLPFVGERSSRAPRVRPSPPRRRPSRRAASSPRVSSVNTTLASGAAASSGSVARVSAIAAATLTRSTLSHASNDWCSIGPSEPSTAAVCTRPSSRPSCARIAPATLPKSSALAVAKIERQDRRLRMPGRDDLVVERLELAHDAPVQHDRRAARRAGERERAAEAAGGAGDQDRAAGEIGRRAERGQRGQDSGSECDGETVDVASPAAMRGRPR